ncbi:MAG: hydrogenase nickel incorporation protein HypB [cyanobacterium endosymbiont of Rhopalodia musculus]|uniref:hydrogenase nickel incorporation protein HypB n=1 Tax=cyanobacterium endosymbiont of Epithemia clementina EcSB TaxID=3034674 RepID=UPI0024815EF3|nr:hydrogenase nickel incorporation protein HypB [cyanobacterium endosymbiont of Epithemia clementina EcSB]WGT68066.1 hydrogenase nickel incorporation protein HypB [cyanobacterium endosymbiont of Epithemia clementina EcSB]
MCVTCGCSGNDQVQFTNLEAEVNTTVNEHYHTHTLDDGTIVTHSHDNQDHYSHFHSNSTTKPSQTHSQIHRTTISLEENILEKNDLIAAQNRVWFKSHSILALNLVSSPGSGKTTLLTKTIKDLKERIKISVIEGDQETANDARKIKETGCKVIQINTGTGCHLEAAMIEKGCTELNPPTDSVLMIENVGNLVCPALFDLGEYAKVAILSITEGEDKPIKYPHMFRKSNVMILTKIDLLPYLQFDVNRCLDYAKQVNPNICIFQVSSITGEGLSIWYDWLENTLKQS